MKYLKLRPEDKKIILDFLKKSIWLQIVSIFIMFVFNFHEITRSIDFDWVTGTLGSYQGNIFIFYLIFCFTIFMSEFRQNKKCLPYAIIAAILTIMTGSIALIFMFIVSFILYSAFSRRISWKNKIIYIIPVLVYLVFFFIITPTWINDYIGKLLVSDNRAAYISKIDDYRNAFYNIPSVDSKFALFGSGVGQYTSRAALTCTGVYIDSYNGFFSPSISDNTRKYIYPKLKSVYDNHLGSMDTPYSTIITIMGEFGYIGLLIWAIYFMRFFLHSSGYSKMFVLFFLLSCFIENYLEFAKIISMVFMCACIIEQLFNAGRNNEEIQ